ncbi:MAG: 50S ribosomal protein L11 methyltransferase [Rhodospirillaceae bacterium]|nr:50S ribosomal protein L11 methyltransferase [Rhodospirillaceae bacterium]
MSENNATWQVSVTLAKDMVEATDLAFEEAGALAVTTFELAPDGDWTVTALFDIEPTTRSLQAQIAQALGATAAIMPISIEEVEDRDWIAETVQAFPPLPIGPYWIHGSHAAPPDLERIPMLIDAGIAFGSGEHATTEGCLLALASLQDRGFRPANALDMGCGSGILAIGAVKLYDCFVLAVDIDPASAAFASQAATDNGAAQRVTALAGDGYATSLVGDRAPYDLIMANILANPLIAMAGDLANVLKPGGIAILSGLLASQADDVQGAHQAAGLDLVERADQRDWSTLTMTKP